MYEGVGVFFLTNTPKTNDKYFKIALNVNIRIVLCTCKVAKLHNSNNKKNMMRDEEEKILL